MLEYIEFIGGISVGIVLGFLAGLWHTRDAYDKLTVSYNDLVKFIMAKQDAGAFITAFPKPDMDKLKQEEEQKNRKEILEYNAMMLRDSVNYGYTDDEIRRFGFDNEGINA